MIGGSTLAENAARGRFPIELDKPRNLWYGFRAMKELKEKHGIRVANLDKMLAEEDGDPNYDNIAILLSYGLRHEDETITPEWVVDNFGVVDLVRYRDEIMRAFGGQAEVSVAPAKAVK